MGFENMPSQMGLVLFKYFSTIILSPMGTWQRDLVKKAEW